MSAIHVIVTCGKRKSVAPADQLQLHLVARGAPRERAHAWIERVRSTRDPRVAAADLYVGEQWYALRSLRSTTSRRLIIWILSAGYGLVRDSARIVPYSATFSTGHADSVWQGIGVSPLRAAAEWWNVLSSWHGPEDAPRRLASIPLSDGDRILIAASPIYLAAIEDDLAQLVPNVAPGAVTIFSGGHRNVRSSLPLARFDGRIRQKLGGSLMSLNARTLMFCYNEIADPDLPSVQAVLDKLSAGLSPLPVYSRVPATDDEVKAFISDALHNGTQSWSPILRSFRSEHKRACEQKRFRALYHDVKEMRSDLS